MTAISSRSKLVDEAYGRLKKDILSSRLQPGFQSLVPDIAMRLRMSRTPVHEALIRLEADGLVELIPRRGVRVTPISIDDMREVYEILTALEPEAAALIAQRSIDPRSLKQLEQLTRNMEESMKSNDLDAWARADDTFHRKLLEIANNRRMSQIVSRLLDQTHRVRLVTLRMRKPPWRSTRDHEEILHHISTGDANAARRAFRTHRQRAAQELLSILKEYQIPPI
jgi:DNA-binding GntR family transcriptional regulator